MTYDYVYCLCTCTGHLEVHTQRTFKHFKMKALHTNLFSEKRTSEPRSKEKYSFPHTNSMR